MNESKKRKLESFSELLPGKNVEYFIYQTMLGVWPLTDKTVLSESDKTELLERILAYLLKASKEGKIYTSWIDPNVAYENALTEFVKDLFSDTKFIKDFTEFQARIALYGAYNSLSQLLLKLTIPGVPDIYQGTEIWNFRLVDPDNRKTINYTQYNAQLDMILALKDSELSAWIQDALTKNLYDGRIKMYILHRSLVFREHVLDLFEKGEYVPLLASGKKAKSVVTFARRDYGSREVVVVTSRFFTELTQKVPVADAWKETYITIDGKPRRFKNALTSEIVESGVVSDRTVLLLEKVFSNLPFALLEKINQ